MRKIIIIILIVSIFAPSLYAYSPDVRDIRQARSMYKRIAFSNNRGRATQYITNGLAAPLIGLLLYPFWAYGYLLIGGYASSPSKPSLGLCCLFSDIVVLSVGYWRFLPKRCKFNPHYKQQYNNGFIAGLVINLLLYVISFAALLGN